MTQKEATQKLLIEIRGVYNRTERHTDKEIAKEIGITPVSFSRLITGVTVPNIQTWALIVNKHAKLLGKEKTDKIITELYYATS